MDLASIRLSRWGRLLPLTLVLLAACAIFGQRRVPKSQITFSHKLHVDAGADCEMCHEEIAQSGRSLDNNLPERDICQSCHEEEDFIGKLPKVIYTRVAATIPRLEYATEYSHKTHVDQGLDCMKCHDSIPESSLAADNNLPLMDVCSECHEVKPQECATCHFALGSEEYIPASHDKALWLTWHKNQAERNDDLCAECHKGDVRLHLDQDILPGPEHGMTGKTKECSNCHRGDVRPDQHGNNYIITHGVDAKVNSDRCNVCHRRAECRDCHETNDSKTRIHPPGWQSIGHAAPARSNLGACVSCHDEQRCLTCHFSISPHPKNWKSRLSSGGARQHKDSAVCMKCHEEEELCTKCHEPKDD
ncbi:cytochrome c3 family protein [Candidatus Poribacteria bacterium]